LGSKNMAASVAPYRPAFLIFTLVLGANFLWHSSGHAIFSPAAFGGGYFSALEACTAPSDLGASNLCNAFISFSISMIVQVLAFACLILLIFPLWLKAKITGHGRYQGLSFRFLFNMILGCLVFGAVLTPANITVLWGVDGPIWPLLGMSQIFLGACRLIIIVAAADPEYFSFL